MSLTYSDAREIVQAIVDREDQGETTYPEGLEDAGRFYVPVGPADPAAMPIPGRAGYYVDKRTGALEPVGSLAVVYDLDDMRPVGEPDARTRREEREAFGERMDLPPGGYDVVQPGALGADPLEIS